MDHVVKHSHVDDCRKGVVYGLRRTQCCRGTAPSLVSVIAGGGCG
jgi:hypothetical protein